MDTVEEQAILEEQIQGTKPPLPPGGERLHYLLSTPFRYGAFHPTGSRFRRAGLTEGVFYAAEEPRTAVAEIVFHRLLFHAESPDTPWPANASEYTAFSAAYRAAKGVDLTKGKPARDEAAWMHPIDYSPCQALADSARMASIGVIRYRSVRDPQHGVNVALLTVEAFARPKPVGQQTWRIRLSATGAQAVCEAPKAGMTFGRKVFAGDPRIAGLRWSRGV